MTAPLLIAGTVIAASIAAASEYIQSDATGQNSVVRAALSTVVQSIPLPGNSNIYRNVGDLPTEEQVQAWMRKVGRPANLRQSIRIVRRVRTSPYPGSNADAQGMDEFAAIAGHVQGIGLPGGQCLAVLCSVETGAGNPFNGNTGRTASLYNNNPGNTKLYSEGGRTLNPTPDVYFLVDRHPSLDFYESHATLETGFASWATRTWGNSRYNQRGPHGEPGCLDAMRSGDLEAFCAALGRSGYAASYKTLMYTRSNGWEVSRYMNGRAQVLTRTGRFRTTAGRPSLSTVAFHMERP